MKFLKGAGDKGAGNGEICEIPPTVNRPILTLDWYDRPWVDAINAVYPALNNLERISIWFKKCKNIDLYLFDGIKSGYVKPIPIKPACFYFKITLILQKGNRKIAN
ncbi:hypothetical protein K0M31_017187 [Melipona bicolor]|uniref:Uncharacterized protein n=1 Tax=Melipona bicolor TaxID=60889 RepID=A0AA40G4W2_9HYME|nr:hypothetical protein K0M31_017187 [Melipona bicolor]